MSDENMAARLWSPARAQARKSRRPSDARAGVWSLVSGTSPLQQSGYKGFEAADRRWAAYGGYGGGGAVILMSLAAVGMAVAGIRVSGRTGEPAVLSVAGLLLSCFAVLVWIGCVAAWHAQAWSLLQ
jgi:hypothetical protein